MNRTLISLNLGSNLVGDAGASKLAEVSFLASKTFRYPFRYLDIHFICFESTHATLGYCIAIWNVILWNK